MDAYPGNLGLPQHDPVSAAGIASLFSDSLALRFCFGGTDEHDDHRQARLFGSLSLLGGSFGWSVVFAVETLAKGVDPFSASAWQMLFSGATDLSLALFSANTPAPCGHGEALPQSRT